MSNRATWLFAICTLSILGGAIIIGILSHQPQPAAAPAVHYAPSLSKSELNTQLTTELPTITQALLTAYPAISSLYTINRGALYDQGQWYGTTLIYQGADTDNRDTLRLLMQKKGGTWHLRSLPPRLILSASDFPDVPKTILQSVNHPAPLPGTATSPAIK